MVDKMMTPQFRPENDDDRLGTFTHSEPWTSNSLPRRTLEIQKSLHSRERTRLAGQLRIESDSETHDLLERHDAQVKAIDKALSARGARK